MVAAFWKSRGVGTVATALLLLTLGSAALAAPPFGTEATSAAAAFQSVSQGTETSAAKESQARAYTLPPGKEAQAIEYAHSRHQLYFLDFLFTTVGLILLIQLAVGPRLRDWAQRVSHHRFLQAVVFAGPFFILLGLLSLPSAAAGRYPDLRIH